MNLHYSIGAPDWEKTTTAKRNYWQRLAAATKGWLTPGNCISFLGLLLVISGLLDMANGHLWRGLLVVAFGRLLDIVDGAVADKTGTKSWIGEGVDAVCDKIGALDALIIFALMGIVYWPVAALIGLQHGAAGLVSMAAKRLNAPIHPRKTGKLATLGEWTALVCLASNYAAHWPVGSWLAIASYLLIAVSLGLGSYATWRYIRTYRRAKSDFLSGAAANPHSKKQAE